jgi:hypothetical protein
MEFSGRVENGVVVLEHGAALPEGAVVTVSCDKVRIWRKPGRKKRVKLPLVESKNPGMLRLTNERIGEIMDEEDASPRH